MNIAWCHVSGERRREKRKGEEEEERYDSLGCSRYVQVLFDFREQKREAHTQIYIVSVFK